MLRRGETIPRAHSVAVAAFPRRQAPGAPHGTVSPLLRPPAFLTCRGTRALCRAPDPGADLPQRPDEVPAHARADIRQRGRNARRRDRARCRPRRRLTGAGEAGRGAQSKGSCTRATANGAKTQEDLECTTHSSSGRAMPPRLLKLFLGLVAYGESKVIDRKRTRLNSRH